MRQAINELENIRDILQDNYDAGDASIEQQQLRLDKIADIDDAIQTLNGLVV